MTNQTYRMKRASLERLIAWLKDQDDAHWNMSDTLNVRDDTDTWDMIDHGEDLDRVPLCHTAGCFAGHIAMIENMDAQRMIPIDVIHNGGLLRKAAVWMGIEQSDDYVTLKDFLFTPALSYHDVTRDAAIKVLEHIRDKGELYWGKFVKHSYPTYGSGISSPLPVELY